MDSQPHFLQILGSRISTEIMIKNYSLFSSEKDDFGPLGNNSGLFLLRSDKTLSEAECNNFLIGM